MNCCSWKSCQNCGRCDDGLRNSPGQAIPFALCDQCGQPFIRGGVSYAGLGTFCGHPCKDIALARRDRHSSPLHPNRQLSTRNVDEENRP